MAKTMLPAVFLAVVVSKYNAQASPLAAYNAAVQRQSCCGAAIAPFAKGVTRQLCPLERFVRPKSATKAGFPKSSLPHPKQPVPPSVSRRALPPRHESRLARDVLPPL